MYISIVKENERVKFGLTEFKLDPPPQPHPPFAKMLECWIKNNFKLHKQTID